MDVKEENVTYLRYLLVICLEKLRKTTRIPIRITGLHGKTSTQDFLNLKQYYTLTLMFSPHLKILTFNRE